MSKEKKVFVNIFCKIYADSFSDEMANRVATGQEIYDFLMRDAQQCYDDEEKVIPGDCNLWYLGCNQKFGHFRYKNNISTWGFGESSFDRVETFISLMYRDGLFTQEQYQALMDKIKEGRCIDNMYDIKDYLICKRAGRSWSKTREASEFREEMKRSAAAIVKYFQAKGYRVYHR
ncbi:hypothetical protein ES703_102637 [subsurface metagenome]